MPESRDMFTAKPTSATLEFAQLRRAFTPRQLGEAFGRDPDTVTRWARRVPHTAELMVDRFWYVMHVATTDACWDLDRARWFLLSIQPDLGGRVPAELVREGQIEPVVDAIVEQGATPTAPEDPFAATIAPEPTTSRELFGLRLARPEVSGRARPLSGADDAFQAQLTADKAVAAPAGSLEH